MTSKVTFNTEFDDKGVNNLVGLGSGKTPYTKVGVLSTTDSRTAEQDGDASDELLSNASIGLKMEFGSLSENIPPRSFLRMPLEKKGKAITRTLLGKQTLEDIVSRIGLEGAAERLGVAAEAVIQEAFASRGFGQWAPNAPLTVALKGSDAPLINTKQLSDSIVSKVEGV